MAHLFDEAVKLTAPAVPQLRVVTGPDVAQTIRDYAYNNDIDLVIVGRNSSKGSSGLAEALLNDECCHRVLVVPAANATPSPGTGPLIRGDAVSLAR